MTMKKDEGLRYARLLKKKLVEAGFPIQQVYLFGSVAAEEVTGESDIDIAVVITVNRDNVHSCHDRACRIGTVSGPWD